MKTEQLNHTDFFNLNFVDSAEKMGSPRVEVKKKNYPVDYDKSGLKW